MHPSAERDLATARAVLQIERWDGASFYAQQAVEKALKALLAGRGDRPPRIHDLVVLSRRVGAPPEFRRDLAELTRVYITTRYPDVVLEPGAPAGVDQAMAEHHVRVAQEVLEWVRQQLSTAS